MQSNIRIKQLLLSCLVFLVSNIHAAPNPDSSSPSSSCNSSSPSKEENTDTSIDVDMMNIIKGKLEKETRSELQYHNLSLKYSGGASKKKTETDLCDNPTASTEDTKKEIKILKGAFGAIDDIVDKLEQTEKQGKKNNDTNIEIDLNELIMRYKYNVLEDKALMVKELKMILEDVFNENIAGGAERFKTSLRSINSDEEKIKRVERILKVFSCLRPNFYVFIHFIKMLKESMPELNINNDDAENVKDAKKAEDIMTGLKEFFEDLHFYELSFLALQRVYTVGHCNHYIETFREQLKKVSRCITLRKCTVVYDYCVSILILLYDLINKRKLEIEKNIASEFNEKAHQVLIKYDPDGENAFVQAEQCTDWQTKVGRKYRNKDLLFLKIIPSINSTN